MSDEPDDSVLVYLRRLDSKVDLLRDEIRDLKHRVSAVEVGLASVRREIAVLSEGQAFLAVRIDKLEERLERVERRLDLVPG